MAPRDHYFNRQYLRRERLQAYVDQIELLKQYSQPQHNILEVGKGGGYLYDFVSKYLGQSIKTIDVLPELNPDYCCDISSPDFRIEETFDVGVCFEVLEHIPWKDLPEAIKNLSGIVRNYLIISVPDTNFFLQAKLNLLWLKYTPLNLIISLPRFFNNRNTFGNGHEWEIGIKQDGKRISADLFIDEIIGRPNLVAHQRGREMASHHFFVLKGGAGR
ncbi:MAG: methyltransferase domain-containing protein [Calditrichia bacterium]